MAMGSLRLRRALTTSIATLRGLSAASAATSPLEISSSPSFLSSSSVQSQGRRSSLSLLQSRAFRASPASLLAFRGGGGGGGGMEEIGPDTILFEGCDYNHWLIVMDFPKENKPSSEEMVRTYEETCARGLNISLEEAKQKMYACSTTTYTGFQAVMTEEESEKFNGLPGVIFVLPDSYIDPQNKEYGGDKYMNGTIIPRPPPIQYRRQTGRYRDQPRHEQPRYDQPRQDRSRPPMYDQEANPQSSNQAPVHAQPPPNQQAYPPYDQHYRAPQNYPPPQQHYGPPGVGNPYQQQGPGGPPGGGNPYQQQGPGGLPGGVNPYQQQGPGGPPGGGNPYQQQGPGGPPPPPQYQENYHQGGGGGGGRQGNYYPQDQRNYGPPSNQQGGYREDYGNYGQGAGGNQGQGGFGRN